MKKDNSKFKISSNIKYKNKKIKEIETNSKKNNTKIETITNSKIQITKTNKPGFTLIEVVVSLAILGLIAMTIVPWFGESFNKLNQASAILNSDYDAQDIIANIKLDSSYTLEADSPFDLEKIPMWYTIDKNTNQVKYLSKDQLQNNQKYEEGLQITLKDKSNGTVFLSTFIRLKKLTLPVKVLDTTEEFIGKGIEGVHLGLYKTTPNKTSGQLAENKLIEIQTTNETGEVFFHLPNDYKTQRYVVMFPDKDQYTAYYKYKTEGWDSNYYTDKDQYKQSQRNDMNIDLTQIESNADSNKNISKLETTYTENIWGNDKSVHITNKGTGSGDIICELLQINGTDYVFDSDTLIGKRGNSRNNFDDGTDSFAGLVNIENNRALEIRYIVRKPVNIRIYAENNLEHFWITNYEHKTGKIGRVNQYGRYTYSDIYVEIPYLWPRLAAYGEYNYLARLKCDPNERKYRRNPTTEKNEWYYDNQHTINTMLFNYDSNPNQGYSFNTIGNNNIEGTIYYSTNDVWGKNSRNNWQWYWRILN